MIIHDNMPRGAELNAKISQTKTVNQGTTAGCRHHQASLQGFAIVKLNPVMGIFGLNRFDGHPELQVYAFFPHFLFGKPSDVAIKPAQEQITAIQQGCINTQPGQDAGKLHSDVATAPDHGLLRQLRQVEHLVGRKNAFLAGHIRNHRPAAGGYRDVFGPIGGIPDHHGIGV